MRNAAGEVIYVGKAARLKDRVRSYFGAPPVPEDLDRGAPVPDKVVATLDRVGSLQRVYEGPNIVIYRVDPDAPVEGAG